MGQVNTNDATILMTEEQSQGVLAPSPVWKQTEPNPGGIAFGATLTTTPRNPMSRLKQRRKGAPIDLESGFSLPADFTVDSMLDHVEKLVSSRLVNGDLTFRAAAAGATAYTVPSLSAEQAARLQFTAGGPISLVHATGYANDANNGTKPLTVNPAAAATAITVGGLVAEAPPANAEVSIAGIRAEAGDLAMTVVGNIGTLTSGNNGATNSIDFTTLGLTLGQNVHVGGLEAANQPKSATDTPTFGYARVIGIAAGALTLDKLEVANLDTGHPALVAFDGTEDNSGGANTVIDLLFGRFARNLPVDDPGYEVIYVQAELGLPNAFETTPPTPVANPDSFEYSLGNELNSLTIAAPLNALATLTAEYIGQDTDTPVDNASRKTNADTPLEPLLTEAFSTAANCARLRITDVDDDGLTTDLTNLTVTISRQASGQNVLCKLGPRFINTGNFIFDIDAQALFTNPLVIAAIRNNDTVSFDMVWENGDGAIAIDVPSGNFAGGGDRTFPADETVQVNLPFQSFVDPVLGTSIGVSFFPVVPAS